ncbi:thioesterase family protein [Falsigemmobacter faecalis]|uniref:Carnitine 3-dehydrogenase n=1 Tax=Falsigemmobacter faecalis TaxID=2488730 RepID=A0A3P3DR10_9RHOB|nr:thioesterase family protein [Falsigemmobacter faecalis]RRH76374.1 hypothetical protein EG244_06360 [Falsigemmobacter faecalis]
MQILIEGCDDRAVEVAARLCLEGHDLLLSGAWADRRAGIDAALHRLAQPFARLSDHPLPIQGQYQVAADVKHAAEGFDLHLQFGAERPGAQLQPGPLPLQLCSPAWLPFCHLTQPTPEAEALLSAAGFLLCTAREMQSADALCAAVADIPEGGRDLALSALLRSLRDQGIGLGARLLARDRARVCLPDETPEGLVSLRVLPSWIDYNGHMTESRYLAACSEVTDAVLRRAGFDLDYVAGGYSYYTVETHLRHLRESKSGQEILGETRVLGVDARRLHLLTILSVEGEAVATLEQMLLHVDMAAGRACAAPESLLRALRAMAAAASGVARPDWLGRGVRSLAPRPG